MIEIPRLSETLHPLLWPHACQRCGWAQHLTVWQEHDDADRRETCHIVLCRPCADRMIETHPRLYRQLAANEPAPGVMAICRGCAHRHNSRCRSPLARSNGGPGLIFPGPSGSMHVSYSTGRGRRGAWFGIYDREPDRCDGYAPAPSEAHGTAPPAK